MFRRAATAIVLVLIASAPALGQSGGRGEELGRVEAERRAREQERDRLRGDARAAAQEVERLRAKLVALAKTQAGGERTVSADRARLAALNAREAALGAKLDADRAKLSRLLSALQLYTRDPPPALVVSPRSANDAVRAAILMRAITPELQRRADSLKAQVEEVRGVRRQAALAGEALFTAESELADRRAQIEGLMARKSALETKLYADAEEADRQARALAQRAADLRGLVQGLAADPTVAAPASYAGPLLTGDPSRLVTPAQGRLVRRFGQRGPTGAASEGWTLATEGSAEVLAPAAGRIEYAGPLKGWGGVVILHLGGGWRVVMAGMDQVAGATGRSVAAGEPVGRMGSRRNPPPELYLEVRNDGVPVDPARWLDAGRGR
jgi:septal ring factor EnvC (AmiA/AmiB activator)